MESLVGKPNYLGRRHRFATTTNRVIMVSNSITSATTYPTYMSASTSSLATFLLLFFFWLNKRIWSPGHCSIHIYRPKTALNVSPLLAVL